jgi:HMG (high mobility group) box
MDTVIYCTTNRTSFFRSILLPIASFSFFQKSTNMNNTVYPPKANMQAEPMNAEIKEHQCYQPWVALSTQLSNAQEALGTPMNYDFKVFDSSSTQYDPLPFASPDMTPLPLNFVSMSQPSSFVLSDNECKLLEDFVEKLNRENGARFGSDRQRSPKSICDNYFMNKPSHAGSFEDTVKGNSFRETSPGKFGCEDVKYGSFADSAPQYYGDTLNSAMKMSWRVGFPPPIPSNDMASNFGTPPLDEDFSESAKPLKALSAYNFFFRYERERLLSGNDTDDDIYSTKTQEMLLNSHWYRDRSQKRRHRKSHGKIDFATLSRMVSQRWKNLPEDRKNFFKEIARKDLQRYRNEQKQLEYSGPVTSESYLYSSCVPVPFPSSSFNE